MHSRSTPTYDVARTKTVICGLRPGRTAIVEVFAYGWSTCDPAQALHDQVTGALAGARYTGWQGLLDAQRAYLDDFWDSADVEVDSDPDCQQAVRFGMFHVLQASARAERPGRTMPGKGLTGPATTAAPSRGCRGYVLPGAHLHPPQCRRGRTPLARIDARHRPHQRAENSTWTDELARGARSAAKSVRPTGRAGTAAWRRQVNADIAGALGGALASSPEDASLEAECGLPRIVERRGCRDRRPPRSPPGACGASTTASQARRVHRGGARQHVRRPDGRQRPACRARRCSSRVAKPAAPSTSTTEEMAAWHDAADAGVPSTRVWRAFDKCDGFTTWSVDFDDDTVYPLLLNQPYVRLYPAQVIKQADLAAGHVLAGPRLHRGAKACSAYDYEPRMVRDSSLSACIQAVLCSKGARIGVGHTDAAQRGGPDRSARSASVIRNGLHMASLAVDRTGGRLRRTARRRRFPSRSPASRGTRPLAIPFALEAFEALVDVDHTEVTYEFGDGPTANSTIGTPASSPPANWRPSTVKLRRRQPALPARKPPKGREPTRRMR